jgi:hypothetical protein
MVELTRIERATSRVRFPHKKQQLQKLAASTRYRPVFNIYQQLA